MEPDTRRLRGSLLVLTLFALMGLWLLPKLFVPHELIDAGQRTAREGQARLLLTVVFGSVGVLALIAFAIHAVRSAEWAAALAEEELQETHLALSAAQNQVIALELKLRLADGKLLSEGKSLAKDLGDHTLSVRLNAVYSMEQLATESERFHWSVMEALSAFVRRNAPRGSQTDAEPAADVLAALSIIGRRTPGREERGCLNFSRTNLAHVSWDGALLTHADFSDACLAHAHLTNALLGMADFDRADLTEAILNKAILNGASLQEAILIDAELRQADLNGAQLTGANLQRAHLAGADMNAAYLTEAELSRADLSRASLFGAGLYGASLAGANLSGANLLMADLTNTNLAGANLSGADLRWAVNLTQMQLDSAITDTSTQVDAPLYVRPVPGSLPAPLRQERLLV